MAEILLLGYGNVDRMDDGLAWHVLVAVAAALGHPLTVTPDEAQPLTVGPVELLFVLQLTPELAEDLAHYQRVGFIDTHLSDDAEDTRLAHIAPSLVTSPFTHHLTPATCLALTQALYGRAPQAVVASARGELFGFARDLSPAAAARVPVLAAAILAWVSQPDEAATAA